jgi:hypothetical protein
MKRIALACGLLLASCSEPASEVSVTVTTKRPVGEMTVERSTEVRLATDADQAAAVRDQLRAPDKAAAAAP